MASILLTGFAPFAGESRNPSWDVLQLLQAHLFAPQHTLHTAQLPCAFGAAWDALHPLLTQWQPELVICLGQAGGSAQIQVERVAINVDDARIADNLGAQPLDSSIVAQADAAYFATLPIKAIVQRLSSRGIPAQISNSAGTYVCNHVFYRLMHYAAAHAHLRQAGFVHIPYSPEQACAHAGAPSMPLTEVARGIEAMLTVCLAQPSLV